MYECRGYKNPKNYVLDPIANDFSQAQGTLPGSIGCKVVTSKDIPLPESNILPKGFILQRIRHLLRYKFISLMVNDKLVLDCACGCGYGSQILSRTARCVYGVDIDDDAISFANKYNISHNIKFKSDDIKSILDDTFDVVVCVETLEHIHPVNVDGFLSELVRVMKCNGQLIITTPIVDVTRTYQNHHGDGHEHRREYSKKDFIAILKSNGLTIEQYVLQNETGDIIYQPKKNLKFKHATKLDSYVQIAICKKSTGDMQ